MAPPEVLSAVEQGYCSQIDRMALFETLLQVREVHRGDLGWYGNADLYTFSYVKGWSYGPGYGLRYLWGSPALTLSSEGWLTWL